MTDLPSLDMPPQEMTRGDSVASNLSDEINSYLGDGSVNIVALEDVMGKLGVMQRGESLDNEMSEDFFKSPQRVLDPNQVATKITPPGNSLPPALPIVGEQNEKPLRHARMDIAGGPGGAVGGMVTNKMTSAVPRVNMGLNPPGSTVLVPIPKRNLLKKTSQSVVPKSSPPPFAHRKLGAIPPSGRMLYDAPIVGEATKSSLRGPPPVRRAIPLLANPHEKPPLTKHISPPIGRRTPPSMSGSSNGPEEPRSREFMHRRFGTEKRPSRRRLPEKRKDGPSGPKEPTEAAKKFLKIQKDKLRDSTTGPNFRPVFSTVRPIVCHYTNTPFYAQCSTAKLGWCTWCQTLRPGNQKQGSICLSCGERLTAKYHRWYPALVRLEPLERDRRPETYRRYRPLFEHYNIKWNDDKQFNFVVQHYMLMKIYLSTPEFSVDALHLERAYMIGVFAGREFNTGALARKLLREGCGLAMFRADFPEFFEVYLLREERASVAESMNQRLFQGGSRAYFHAHHTNIEGWYDQSIVGREQIVQLFKDLCNNVLSKNAGAAFGGPNGGPPMIPRGGTPVDPFGPPSQLPPEPSMHGQGGPPPGMQFMPPQRHEPMNRMGAMHMGPPMGSPPMGIHPQHIFGGPPPGMLPPGPHHGGHFQQGMLPMGFSPTGPPQPVRGHPFMPPYGMPMVSPPGPPHNNPYMPLPMQRSIPSVTMTTPTPPPPFMPPNTPFDRQMSGGSSVSGATFVPHNAGLQGNARQNRF